LWEQPTGRVECADHPHDRAGALELAEEILDGAADLLIGVFDDLAILVIDKPDGKGVAKVTAVGRGQLRPMQPS
jgi:hypothetical protein